MSQFLSIAVIIIYLYGIHFTSVMVNSHRSGQYFVFSVKINVYRYKIMVARTPYTVYIIFVFGIVYPIFFKLSVLNMPCCRSYVIPRTTHNNNTRCYTVKICQAEKIVACSLCKTSCITVSV